MRLGIICFMVLLPAILSAVWPSPLAAPSGIFLCAVVLWFTELLPLPVTGLLIPVLTAVYGALPAGEAFHAFGSDVLFLFIGCFFMAAAMQKHGWDRRMAYWVLSSRFGSRSPGHLIILISAMSCVFSMGISNTATCAMMVPICLGLITVFRERFESEKDLTHFSRRLLLSVAFASTMGGLATPVGTPPNLIALQFLQEQGIEVSFLHWFGIGLPITLAMMAGLILVLRWCFPLSSLPAANVDRIFREKLHGLGPLKREELQTAAAFSVAVVLWIAPGLLRSFFPEAAFFKSFADTFTISIVGIGAALPLFFLSASDGRPNLLWQDAVRIDWGTVLLFGGGLTLGRMLDVTGLADEAGALVFASAHSLTVIVVIAAVLSILMSEFASNTASAAVVIPVVLASALSGSADEWTMILVVLAASFAASFGFMLPVSTPPNALVFGTGKVPLPTMIRTGMLFDLLGFFCIIGWLLFLIP